MSDWISVEDRLPEEAGIYPAVSMHNDRNWPENWIDSFCYFHSDAGPGKVKWQHSTGFYDGGITHWMPLPEPPMGSSLK